MARQSTRELATIRADRALVTKGSIPGWNLVHIVPVMIPKSKELGGFKSISVSRYEA